MESLNILKKKTTQFEVRNPCERSERYEAVIFWKRKSSGAHKKEEDTGSSGGTRAGGDGAPLRF